jgi:hypothetical protein
MVPPVQGPAVVTADRMKYAAIAKNARIRDVRMISPLSLKLISGKG